MLSAIRNKTRGMVVVGLFAPVVVAVTMGLPAVSSTDAMVKVTMLEVLGIPGPYCAYGVEKRLLELVGVTEVM